MKKFLALALAVVMIFALAACGQQAAPAAAPAADAAPAAEAAPAAPAADEHTPVTLQVSIVESDFLDSWIDNIKPKFEAEYPWITLEDVGTGESKTEFHSTRAAADDLPPVMQTDNGDVYYALIKDGKLVDLSGTEAASHIPQSYLDAYTYDGCLFGLTQGAAYDACYFNMAILKDAGVEAVPTNWDEFIACCEKVQAAGYDVITYAGAKTTTTWMIFETIVATEVIEAEGEGFYETNLRQGTLDISKYPAIVTKMEQIAPFIAKGASTSTEDDVTATMTDGNCAIAIAGNWTSNNITSGIAEATGNPDDAVMVPPPFANAGGKTYIAASPESAFGMSVVSDSAIEEARDIFFEWIFKPENFRFIQNARGTLPVLDNMDSSLVELAPAVLSFSTAANGCVPFSMSFNNCGGSTNEDTTTAINECFIGSTNAATAVATINDIWAKNVKG